MTLERMIAPKYLIVCKELEYDDDFNKRKVCAACDD